MNLGLVAGTVVSNRRADGISAPTYLLIEQCDQQGKGKHDYLVALDLVGAGRGEVVLLGQGSSARQTTVTDNRPMDAVVIAIVDTIDEHGTTVYQK
ncbi:ethanolamine utilization protein EutN/carboxysome structural protein Ccml [Candidatus Moduliflexus flocculans]|uniref:Ethanolamine utilization protein EutN/carboxysome structural protein Ccml n=1 Tax=Candidatus Moduliflexus flocculans TaxID=1499966 RepID=A0A0S6VSU6_9BACT|nr:ethanolamine utilization protein EutN/carboxysome structural protein Ccml [Candidatus Moduliflexus flocculans]